MVRTQPEIQQNRHHRLTGNESGLVGYRLLNEGSSNTTYDKTSHANHGTIHGANWVQSEIPIANPQSNVELGVDQIMAKDRKTTPSSSEAEESQTDQKKTSPTEKAIALATYSLKAANDSWGKDV